jgi:hypothetical protein
MFITTLIYLVVLYVVETEFYGGYVFKFGTNPSYKIYRNKIVT